MKTKLEVFLEKCHLTEKFQEELINDGGFKTVKQFMRSFGDKHGALQKAFVWNFTLDGAEYWEDYNVLFNHSLKNK